MNLCIDVGNTNTVFAVCEGGSILYQWRISTDRHRTSDEYGAWLLLMLGHAQLAASDIKAAIIASVVPESLFEMQTLCRRYFSCEAKVVGDQGVRIPMKILLDRPSELGADRLVNAYGAWLDYQQALIVVDFGTATTFDVVNQAGEYRGGVIAPGVNLSLEALQRAAAKLPNVAIGQPRKVIGANTIEAMQSGIYYGYVGLIEGILVRIQEELGGAAQVVATGGLASLYATSCPMIARVDGDLTIRALARILTAQT